jgi:hypothetical protein
MPRKHRLFERFLKSAHRILIRRYGQSLADDVRRAARQTYQSLHAQVPDIGGIRNIYQPVMAVNGWIVALHRALLAQGRSARDTISISAEVFDAWFRKIPGSVLLFIGRIAFSNPSRRTFIRQAQRSQLRRYPEDFVWSVEERPDGELALVFEECAVNKWYEAQNVPELKPYCNFVDLTYSRLMGMGVDARDTIGLGCKQCTLSYQHGRATIIPENLLEILPG